MRETDKTIEVMKQALEALELTADRMQKQRDAITALRAAIAEASMQRLTDVQQEMEAPRVNQCAEVCERAKLCAICARGLEEMEQDPVAWADIEQGAISWMKGEYGPTWEPLYTHPPRREWGGLTDEGVRQAAQAMDAEPLADGWEELVKFARAIEAKLKEKNS